MDWNAIGAVGEILGALAVVISVIYLARQIKGQTEQARLDATREIAGQYDDILNHIIEDKDLAALYLRGVAEFHTLPGDERVRISCVFQRIMRLMELKRLHITKGNIDPLFFDSVNRSLLEWLTFPGTQVWWDGFKEFHEPGFRESIDAMIIEAKAHGYESSFKAERERNASTLRGNGVD